MEDLKAIRSLGIGGLIADTAAETFQIVNRIQVFPDLFPGNHVCVQFLDGFLALLDLFQLDQRLFQIIPEKPARP